MAVDLLQLVELIVHADTVKDRGRRGCMRGGYGLAAQVIAVVERNLSSYCCGDRIWIEKALSK